MPTVTFVCSDCRGPTGVLINGRCPTCVAVAADPDRSCHVVIVVASDDDEPRKEVAPCPDVS